MYTKCISQIGISYYMTRKYCVIARAAAYAIDPSIYDLVFESPDRNAKLKFTVRTLNGRNWLRPEDGMTYDLSRRFSHSLQLL